VQPTTTTSSTSTSTTTLAPTTTTTTFAYSCNCLNWTSAETSIDTNISWIDCDNVLQTLLIPSGELNVDITRCGSSPTSDNGEVIATEGTKPCSAQPNGTFVCVEPPCTLYYIYQSDPSDPNYAEDYFYYDCNTGLQDNGSFGTATPLGPCISVYAQPGSITVIAGTEFNTTGCPTTTTTTTIP
jgi:hypothetical protein